MKYIIKLLPRGTKGKKNYDIVIMHKTSPIHGKFLAKLGFFLRLNANYDVIFIDKKKLHFWLLRGLMISNRLKKYLKYC